MHRLLLCIPVNLSELNKYGRIQAIYMHVSQPNNNHFPIYLLVFIISYSLLSYYLRSGYTSIEVFIVLCDIKVETGVRLVVYLKVFLTPILLHLNTS